MIWLEYALAGLFAGFLAGYLGIGGGLVLVPVLSWLFSHDPATADMAVQMAVATSLATMLFTSMSSLLSHQKHGAILWPLVKQMLPGLLAGALLGSIIADGIGGGSMTVPWLLWHGQKVQKSIATAAACGYPIAVAGTLGFVLLGDNQTSAPALGYVHLQALAGVALFSVFGAPLGVAAVHRSSPLLAKRFFAVFLLVVAVKMIFR
jgi:uncharacterized membrane protein YfcA